MPRNNPDKHQVGNELLTVEQIAERVGCKTPTIYARLNRGETGEELVAPLRIRGRPRGSRNKPTAPAQTKHRVSSVLSAITDRLISDTAYFLVFVYGLIAGSLIQSIAGHFGL